MREEIPHYLTVAELCQRCRVGRTFVYEHIKRGTLKPTKFGRMTRFREADVQLWIETLCGTSGA